MTSYTLQQSQYIAGFIWSFTV